MHISEKIPIKIGLFYWRIYTQFFCGMNFFFYGDRSSNSRLCIYYTLFLSIELNSQELFVVRI